MKGLRFRSAASYVRGQNVPSPAKRSKINWGANIYLGILAAAVIAGVYYLASGFLFVDGEGHVIFDKQDIQHTEDLRIIRHLVAEGDSVKQGDPLFVYVAGDPLGQSLVEAHPGERRTVEYFSARGLEREYYIERLRKHRQAYELLRKEVALQLYAPDRLYQLQEKIDEIELQLRKLAGESALAGGATFYAPSDGTVTKINRLEHEVALKGEVIMELYKPENIHVKAYFEQRYLGYIGEGQTVDLVFPDGSRSRGVIERFYFSTFPLPPEFQKRFEPTHRDVAVDIRPLNPEEAQRWQAFYKLNVKVVFGRWSGPATSAERAESPQGGG